VKTREEFEQMLTLEERKDIMDARREVIVKERTASILKALNGKAGTIKEIQQLCFPDTVHSYVFTLIRKLVERGILEKKYEPSTLVSYYIVKKQ